LELPSGEPSLTGRPPPPEAPDEPAPAILPRKKHRISRRHIDPNALKILYRLKKHGFRAYLVGGSVRDLLLGRRPKDFDIGTDARLGQLRKLFKNARVIGRRFKLVHVRFRGNQIIEVATFRRAPTLDEIEEYGAENIFGTARQDAMRRDFTVNALFYNIGDFSVIDHVGGLEDMERKVLRVIGEPDVRYLEDPVRMLRALEFSHRLGFELDPDTRAAIPRRAHHIETASRMRLKEELLNLFRQGISGPVLREAEEVGLYKYIFPGVRPDPLLWKVLELTDPVCAEMRDLPTWYVVVACHLAELSEVHPWRGGGNLQEAEDAIEELVAPLTTHYSIGAHMRHIAREHLLAFWRIGRGPGGRGEVRFRRRDVFRPALSIFRLWVRATDRDVETLAAWEEAQPKPSAKPAARPGPRKKKKGRRRRKRGGKKRKKPGGPPPSSGAEFPDTSGR
jgi:poly(A) polymerase